MTFKSSVRELTKNIPPLFRFLNEIRGMRLHRPDIRGVDYSLERQGYGHWPVPKLGKGVAYCFGIGKEKTFEDLLAKNAELEVHMFDPSPECIAWLESQNPQATQCFHPYGLSAEDGFIEFTDIPDKSLTSVLKGYTGALVRLQTKRLQTIMFELGHSHLELLKMDIEGQEYSAIDALVSTKVRPRYLLVEFHHSLYGITQEQTKAAVNTLNHIGYKSFWVSDYGREYAFVFAQ